MRPAPSQPSVRQVLLEPPGAGGGPPGPGPRRAFPHLLAGERRRVPGRPAGPLPHRAERDRSRRPAPRGPAGSPRGPDGGEPLVLNLDARLGDRWPARPPGCAAGTQRAGGRGARGPLPRRALGAPTRARDPGRAGRRRPLRRGLCGGRAAAQPRPPLPRGGPADAR